MIRADRETTHFKIVGMWSNGDSQDQTWLEKKNKVHFLLRSGQTISGTGRVRASEPGLHDFSNLNRFLKH